MSLSFVIAAATLSLQGCAGSHFELFTDGNTREPPPPPSAPLPSAPPPRAKSAEAGADDDVAASERAVEAMRSKHASNATVPADSKP